MGEIEGFDPYLLCLLAVPLSGLLVWYILAPSLDDLLRRSESDLQDLPLFLNRVTGVVLVGAAVFFVTIPREVEWFGSVGGYFAPFFAFITLVVISLALGLQRGDLQVTRDSLLLIQRQILDAERAGRQSDRAIVLVKKFLVEAGGQPKATVHAGGNGPALNLRVSLVGRLDNAEEVVFFEKRFGILFRENPISFIFSPVLPGAKSWISKQCELKMVVRWENIHQTVFSYAADYRRDIDGAWEAPSELEFASPTLQPVEGFENFEARLAEGRKRSESIP